MTTPFKNLGDTGENANEYLQTKKITPLIPKKRDPQINTELTDVVPDHPPEIPWPAAVAVDHKPMKNMK